MLGYKTNSGAVVSAYLSNITLFLRESLQMSVGPLLYELQKNIREATEPSSANINARYIHIS